MEHKHLGWRHHLFIFSLYSTKKLIPPLNLFISICQCSIQYKLKGPIPLLLKEPYVISSISRDRENKALNKGFFLSFFFLLYKILHASGFTDMLFCGVLTFST